MTASLIDLHTHTFASDGVLLPSELIRRAQAAGYLAIGITDHGDESNLDDLLKRAVTAARVWADDEGITVIPGVEITHVPPARIPEVAARARELGARLVVVHGETITEPVAPGTNSAAVRCPDVDILAHPGLLTVEDSAAAAQNGIHEGAKLIFGTDAHAPGDLVTVKFAQTVLRGAGIGAADINDVFNNAQALLEKIEGR